MDSCYAMVRGSTIRVTELTKRGSANTVGPIRYAVSEASALVRLDEKTDQVGDQVVRTEIDSAPRIKLVGEEDPLGYVVSGRFLRADPGLLGLMTSVLSVHNDVGDVVGFDADTRLPVSAFALEVWSKLTVPRQWGYTLLPLLRGGYLSGFEFANASVDFNISRADTQQGSLWNVGPYDFLAPFERLVDPVSRNKALVQFVTEVPPPDLTCGVQETEDRLDNGTSPNPMPYPTAPDRVVGGSAGDTSDWIVEGGGA